MLGLGFRWILIYSVVDWVSQGGVMWVWETGYQPVCNVAMYMNFWFYLTCLLRRILAECFGSLYCLWCFGCIELTMMMRISNCNYYKLVCVSGIIPEKWDVWMCVNLSSRMLCSSAKLQEHCIMTCFYVNKSLLTCPSHLTRSLTRWKCFLGKEQSAFSALY